MKKIITYILLLCALLVIGSTSASNTYIDNMDITEKESTPISKSTSMILLGIGLIGLSTVSRNK